MFGFCEKIWSIRFVKKIDLINFDLIDFDSIDFDLISLVDSVINQLLNPIYVSI